MKDQTDMEVIFVKKTFDTLADAQQASQNIHGSVVFDAGHGALYVDGKLYGKTEVKETVRYVHEYIRESDTNRSTPRRIQDLEPIRPAGAIIKPQPVIRKRCIGHTFRSCVIGEQHISW